MLEQHFKIMYKIHVNWLFMSSVRLWVKGWLSVIKFWGSQMLHVGFHLCGGGDREVGEVSAPNLLLFKGQL